METQMPPERKDPTTRHGVFVRYSDRSKFLGQVAANLIKLENGVFLAFPLAYNRGQLSPHTIGF